MLIGAKCKKCRSLGTKLLLNERCASQKCALTRRRVRPGMHGKKPRSLTLYAKQLLEKQKLRFIYLLKEKQLRRYVEMAERSKLNVQEALIQILERRLDNVIWRANFVTSKTMARQLVAHGHFLVNGRKTRIPSYLVEVGDVISIRPQSLKIKPFEGLAERLKRSTPPRWLSVDADSLEIKVIDLPKLEEVHLPVDLSVVIDFYSR
jgi:small subunit ribosomal protein S4